MTDPAATSAAGRLLESAIAGGVFPAAVAEVGSRAEVLWRFVAGALTFDRDAARTGDDTIFDLASLTKPLVTTTVALSLVERGRSTL
jgi:serine-type D-Ala-D-Ala carboxypeptidase